jgi:lipoprotein-releasing system permease protein
MGMAYERFISRRYLKALRGGGQTSFTTLIAVSGVTLGVAALVIVLSVFNGFSDLLWEGLLSVNPHVIVQRPYGQPMSLNQDLITQLEKRPDVASVAPFIASEGFLLRKPPGGELIQAGVVIRGVDADDLLRVSSVVDRLWAGDTLDLDIQPTSGRAKVYGMVIGRGLADRMGALLGAEVMLGLLAKEILVGQQPQWRTYVVTGIYHTGVDELDSALAFISREAAQRDLGWENQISGIQLRLDDPFQANILQSRLTLPDLDVVTWMDEHRNLYASIRMEKWFGFLVLSLIVAVAGFNVISILMMTVAEKKKEIGVLKALGTAPKAIGRIFTYVGLGIGFVGVFLGNAIGFFLCWLQQTFELIRLPGQLYIIQALPVRMYATDFAMISVVSVGLCLAFTLFPSRDAASVDPIEALRDG